MRRGRYPSPEVSAAVVEYVMREKGITETEMAEVLEVSLGFMSRLKSLERSLTVDHLQALEQIAGMPLGALFLAAVPFPTPTPKTQRLHDLCRQALLQGDKLVETIRRSQAAKKRS